MIDDWISLGDYKGVKCKNCNFIIENAHSVDHHTSYCPNCKSESIFFDFGNGRVTQILLEKSPEVFISFVRWSQKELDELEIVDLIDIFSEINSRVSPLNK